MWFAKNQKRDKITLHDISDDTNIPVSTIHDILRGKRRYGVILVDTCGTNDWPLAHIGFRCGYWVTWVGRKRGYINVRKVKDTEEYY